MLACLLANRLVRWQSERSRSHSPDTTASASSVFDTSAGDASWATTATDVDLDRAAAVTTAAPRVGLTREQAREVRRPYMHCVLLNAYLD